MSLAPLLILLALAGCGDKVADSGEASADTDGDADTDADTDGDVDADTDGDTDADLPYDPVLDSDVCEDVPGFEDVAGATSYYVGDLFADGDRWTGTESWRLFATSEWEAAGGGDCVAIWDVTGRTVAGGGACGSCAFSIELSMSLDTGATTCPGDLTAGAESFSITYAVEERAGGAAGVYFAGSGNPLGTGVLTPERLSYVTEAACRWF